MPEIEPYQPTEEEIENHRRLQAEYEAHETDPDHRPTRDPASLLPYVCEIEPSDPNVERLTGGYSGSNSHSILDADSRNRGI